MALRRLRSGKAVVYTGGDYHNARQLLQAVKRKIAGTSGAQKRKKKKKRRNQLAVGESSVNDQFALGEEWAKQRKLQHDQAELVHKILIQVSLGDDGMPNQIIGLKRTPTNARDVFAYAFQNDKEVMTKLRGDGIASRLSSQLQSYFLISLAEFIAMVGGYEWNKKGVYVHALQDYIVPHFGVFPPTRQDYLQLMDHVAIERTTRRRSPLCMLEIGVGSGVLSLILLKRKAVDYLIGTDINPNAVACAKENMKRFGFRGDIMLVDLFPSKTTAIIDGEANKKFDVVLFNPPWVPGNASTWLDKSVYDPDQNLLRRFLSQVQHHVKEDGHIYLLLSNIGMLLGLFKEKDLHDMFAKGNLELVEVHTTESKAEATKRRRTKEMEREQQQNLGGIERSKAQEVISLYHLCVKKFS